MKTAEVYALALMLSAALAAPTNKTSTKELFVDYYVEAYALRTGLTNATDINTTYLIPVETFDMGEVNEALKWSMKIYKNLIEESKMAIEKITPNTMGFINFAAN
jgi:hypothetical protein